MSKCTECNEYDKEKFYCPKWCEVIKGTIEDARKDERAKTIEEFYEKLTDNFEKNLQSVHRNKLPNLYANLDRSEIDKIYEQMKGGVK